jgi:hypothetical protein
MALKAASEVARRCMCLELLLQRLGLEIDEDDSEAERDVVREAWLSRLGDLGLEGVLAADERAFLELRVGALTDEQIDEIEGRIICALIILWALGRLGERPSAKMLGDATDLVTKYGILGDGSIPKANATAASVTLRPESELRAAMASYAEKQGDGRGHGDHEEMVSVLAVHTLSSILDG